MRCWGGCKGGSGTSPFPGPPLNGASSSPRTPSRLCMSGLMPSTAIYQVLHTVTVVSFPWDACSFWCAESKPKTHSNTCMSAFTSAMNFSWSSQVAVMASRLTSTAVYAIAYITSQGSALHLQQSQSLFFRPVVSWQPLVYNLWLASLSQCMQALLRFPVPHDPWCKLLCVQVY